jgi:hypothetical protein
VDDPLLVRRFDRVGDLPGYAQSVLDGKPGRWLMADG